MSPLWWQIITFPNRRFPKSQSLNNISNIGFIEFLPWKHGRWQLTLSLNMNTTSLGLHNTWETQVGLESGSFLRALVKIIFYESISSNPELICSSNAQVPWAMPRLPNQSQCRAMKENLCTCLAHTLQSVGMSTFTGIDNFPTRVQCSSFMASKPTKPIKWLLWWSQQTESPAL